MCTLAESLSDNNETLFSNCVKRVRGISKEPEESEKPEESGELEVGRNKEASKTRKVKRPRRTRSSRRVRSSEQNRRKEQQLPATWNFFFNLKYPVVFVAKAVEHPHKFSENATIFKRIAHFALFYRSLQATGDPTGRSAGTTIHSIGTKILRAQCFIGMVHTMNFIGMPIHTHGGSTWRLYVNSMSTVCLLRRTHRMRD